MNDDLSTAIDLSLQLDRDTVKSSGEHWTWENCWNIFHKNLIKK
jgi:hypothetical protein